MKNHLKLILAVSLSLSFTPAYAQEKIMIAEPTWPGAKIMANIIGQIVETKLGAEMGYAPGSNPVIFAAMDGGRGDIDVHPDVWLPNQQALVDDYVKNKGTVLLSEGYYEGRAGFCTPTYMKDRNINSVFDLATPEAQKAYDSDGDGKGEVWVGAPGWASTNTTQVKVRDYGIGSFLEPLTEDETIFYSRMKRLIDEKKGVVFYCYAPHYVFALYDLFILDEPKHDLATYQMVTPTDSADWFNQSHVSSADPSKTVHVAYSNTLKERNPIVADFLSRIDMDAADLSKLNYEMIVNNRPVGDVVSEWIAANPTKVDGWLGLN